MIHRIERDKGRRKQSPPTGTPSSCQHQQEKTSSEHYQSEFHTTVVTRMQKDLGMQSSTILHPTRLFCKFREDPKIPIVARRGATLLRKRFCKILYTNGPNRMFTIVLLKQWRFTVILRRHWLFAVTLIPAWHAAKYCCASFLSFAVSIRFLQHGKYYSIVWCGHCQRVY